MYSFLKIDVDIMYYFFSFSTTFIREDGCIPPLLYIRLLLCSDFFRYFHRNIYLSKAWLVNCLVFCYLRIFVYLCSNNKKLCTYL